VARLRKYENNEGKKKEFSNGAGEKRGGQEGYAIVIIREKGKGRWKTYELSRRGTALRGGEGA